MRKKNTAMRKKETTMQGRKKFLINMTLRKLVQALSYIWFKDTALRKDMDTMRPNQICLQKNSSSIISSTVKSTYLKKT